MGEGKELRSSIISYSDFFHFMLWFNVHTRTFITITYYFQDKDQKMNEMIQEGLTPPKDFSSSTAYQQIIREITGGMPGNKAANKRGRGRSVNKANDLMSPTKDLNAPRVRGRPRGSRNKTPNQRNRGKVSCGVWDGARLVAGWSNVRVVTDHHSLLHVQIPVLSPLKFFQTTAWKVCTNKIFYYKKGQGNYKNCVQLFAANFKQTTFWIPYLIPHWTSYSA